MWRQHELDLTLDTLGQAPISNEPAARAQDARLGVAGELKRCVCVVCVLCVGV